MTLNDLADYFYASHFWALSYVLFAVQRPKVYMVIFYNRPLFLSYEEILEGELTGFNFFYRYIQKVTGIKVTSAGRDCVVVGRPFGYGTCDDAT